MSAAQSQPQAPGLRAKRLEDCEWLGARAPGAQFGPPTERTGAGLVRSPLGNDHNTALQSVKLPGTQACASTSRSTVNL